MATSLRFDISSGWDGSGVDDASARITALKKQIDDLTGKKIEIDADASRVKAQIEQVKAELYELQNKRISIDADDTEAKTAMDEVMAKYAELQALTQKQLDIQVKKDAADSELAAFKAELKRLQDQDTHFRLSADASPAEKALADARADFQRSADDAQKAWQGAGDQMSKAAISMAQAVTAFVVPAVVQLGALTLSLGGSIISGFGGAAVAAGVFGLSVRGTYESANSLYTTTKTLNGQLSLQEAQLKTLTPGSAQYQSVLQQIHSTQAQLNAAMAQATPFEREMANGLGQLRAQWQATQQTAEQFTGPLIMNGLKIISNLMDGMVPIIKAVSAALAPVVEQFKNWSAGSGFQKFVNWIIAYGVPALKNAVLFIKNLFIIVGQIGTAFQTQGQHLMQFLVKVTAEIIKWGQGGGFQRFASEMSRDAQNLKPVLEDLWKVIQKLTGSFLSMYGVLGPTTLVLRAILPIIAALPVGVVNAFMDAFLGYKVIMAATAAIKAVGAAVKGIQAAYAAGKMAVLGFRMALAGTALTTKDGTAALLANRAALAAQAVARWAVAAATWAWGAAQAFVDAVTATFEALLDAIGIGELLMLIGLIIAAIVGLVIGIMELVKHWRAVWTEIKQIAEDVWDFLKHNWKLLILAFGPIGWLIDIATSWRTVWSGIKAVGEDVWAFLKSAWKDTTTALRTAWTDISGFLTASWDTVWNGIKSVGESVWTALKTAWTAVVDALRTAWTDFSGFFTGAWDALWNGVKAVGESIWTALKTAWTDTINTIRSIFTDFDSFFTAAWSAMWNAAKTVGTSIWDGLRTAWTSTINAIRSVWTDFDTFLTSTWDTLWNGVKSVGESIWSGLQSAWNNTTHALRDATQWCHDQINNIWSDLKKVFGSPIEFVVNTVLNGGLIKAVNWVIDKMSFGAAKSAIPNIPDPGLPHFATGGMFRGAGTGTSDSNLAWLSDGEYVINASAAAYHGTAALDAINAGKPIGAFAGGGPNGNLVNEGQGADVNAINRNGDSNVSSGFTDATLMTLFSGIIQSVGGVGAGLFADLLGGAGSIAGAVGSALNSVAKSGIPVISQIAGFLGGGADMASEVADAMASAIGSWGEKEFEEGTQKLIDYIVKNFIPQIPTPYSLFGTAAHGVLKTGATDFLSGAAQQIGDFLFGQKQKYVQSFGVMGQVPTGEQAAIIEAALTADGVPASQWGMWLSGMNTLIQRESGWNASAVNNVDINAQEGHPSEGLAQVIAPTFAAYRNPGLPDNLLDPVANVAAAINYIRAVYGGIGNVEQANPNLPPKGYDIGGPLMPGYTLAYNTTGQAEGVLNPAGLAAVGGFTGLAALNNGSYTYSGGGGGLNGSGQPVVVEVTNNWYGNPDRAAVEEAGNGMAEALRQAVLAGVGQRMT